MFLNLQYTQIEEIFDGGAIAMIDPRNEHQESNKRIGSEGIGCTEPIVLAKKAEQSNFVSTTVNKTTMKALVGSTVFSTLCIVLYERI